MNYNLLIFILILSIFYTTKSYSRVRNFETTFLKSTAGAGVGSLLMDEGAILNPAPLGFFNASSLYLQNYKQEYDTADDDTKSYYNTLSEKSESWATIISDTRRKGKGAISYQKIQEKHDERERMTLGLGHKISKQSSFGVQYSYTKDINFNNFQYVKEKYQQVNFGVLHVLDEDFSLGFLAIDPIRKVPEDTNYILGLQYIVKGMMAIMVDIGADYKAGLSETLNWKSAMQLNVYKDLFLRGGIFNDKKNQEKGNGVGVGWVGPKLIINIALKQIKPTGESSTLLEGDVLKETSFSASYKF